MSKILIIDDDLDIQETMGSLLESEGFQVHAAETVEKGLEMIQAVSPDLVLLDMMMSYILDGVDVRRTMMEDPLLKAVPVIMMTSATVARGEGAAAMGEDAPTTMWLSKPLNPDGLLTSVNQAMA